MIEQPQLAVIRTDAVGLDFYDRVMDRITGRQRRPHGIAIHFAGMCQHELFVVTIYRDLQAQVDMFTDFSAPEITNELHESGARADLSRDEHAIERLWIAETFTPISERPMSEPAVAYLLRDEPTTADVYEESIERSRFPEIWPDGLQLHAVFSQGKRLGVLDIWTRSDAAEDHYMNSIRPNASIVQGEALPESLFRNKRIDLHALTVTLAPDDPLRTFSKLRRNASA